MKMSEYIRQRRSVRTFDGRTLSAEDAEKILSFARGVENPYELSITWEILEAKKYGLNSPVIAGADTFIAGKMRRAAHAEEAFGYTFEKIVLYAQSLGIGTTWIAGTMNRAEFERAMRVSKDEVMPCVSPLGYPAKKMSLRETMMRKGVKADSRLDFGELFFDESFKIPLSLEQATKRYLPLEMVRLSPSAVNKQPWRVVLIGDKAHFYEKKNRGYDDGSWDLQKIDLGIALCHFEIGAKECGIRTSLSLEDPGLSDADGLIYIATYTLENED